jgi:probable 2-oxoglutarate dehydrogenase E1 component DHKTD1
MRAAYASALDTNLADVEAYKPKSEMLEGNWSSMVWPASAEAQHDPDTGLEVNQLIEVAKASVTLADGFVSG